MRPGRGRALLLDVPLALAVGALSWAAAEFWTMAGRFDGGPWRRGPGDGPMMGGGFDPSQTVAFSWVLFPCLVLLVVALALRRIRPRAGFVLVVVGVAGYLAAGGPSGPVLLAPALALHALALDGLSRPLPFQRWVPLTLLLVPMLVARSWDQPYLGLLEPSFYAALVTGVTLMLVPAMLGLLWRSRRESDRQQRADERRRYAYEERLQIARDVHDVVGHSLSVINLQAGVALHVLHKRPDEVEPSLEAIKRTSREALAELRTTLAVYRDPTADTPLAPPPGLARLDDLVSALQAAGREVSVRREGELPGLAGVAGVAGSLPAAVDQAAYRIIQEALTNVVRHAEGAGASVLVQRSDAALVLEVSNVLPRPVSPRPVSPRPVVPVVEGSGITGMRERASALGGTLWVDAAADGAFRVRAELPLTPYGRLP